MIMKSPKASVIIPVYNTEKYVEEPNIKEYRNYYY